MSTIGAKIDQLHALREQKRALEEQIKQLSGQMDVLENCWLDLHENGMIRCALEVRYVSTTEGRTGKPFWHMGCKFVKLPSADEVQMQRFMARIEAERRALAAG